MCNRQVNWWLITGYLITTLMHNQQLWLFDNLSGTIFLILILITCGIQKNPEKTYLTVTEKNNNQQTLVWFLGFANNHRLWFLFCFFKIRITELWSQVLKIFRIKGPPAPGFGRTNTLYERTSKEPMDVSRCVIGPYSFMFLDQEWEVKTSPSILYPILPGGSIFQKERTSQY